MSTWHTMHDMNRTEQFSSKERAQVKIEVEEGDDDEDMDDDSNDDEEVVVPEGVNVDPAVLSTLPPSMQVRLNHASYP